MHRNKTVPEIGDIVTDSGLTWDLIVRIVFAFFGILANLVNLAVFLSPKLQDITYKYMLINTVFNLIYLVLSLCSVFYYYCSTCASSQTYAAAVFSLLLTFYLLDCLKLLHVLIQITISMRIYFILINKNTTIISTSYKLVTFIIICISLVFFLQEPFSFYIANFNNTGSYYIDTNSFGNSITGKALILAQFAIRILLAVFVLSGINALNVIEFKKRYNGSVINKSISVQPRELDQRKDSGSSLGQIQLELQINGNSLKNRSNETYGTATRTGSNKSLIRMVIISSFMNAAGTLPYSLVYIAQQILTYHGTVGVVFNLSIALLYALLGLDTFVYYSFNKLYRQVLQGYLNTIISFIRRKF